MNLIDKFWVLALHAIIYQFVFLCWLQRAKGRNYEPLTNMKLSLSHRVKKIFLNSSLS